MAIWLRREIPKIGVPDGIVRCNDWLQLVELDAAFLAVDELRKSICTEANEDAAQISEAARQQAQKCIDDATHRAETLFETARRKGYQAGLEEWTALSLRATRKADAQLRRERARMAKIVIAAVEKIIPLQDPQGIYKQVLRVLSKSIQAVRYVSVRVCPDEVATAQAAFNELAAGSPFAKLIEVIGDDSVMAGTCLVESDQGIIDLSLNSQINALRTAIEASFGDSDSVTVQKSKVKEIK